MEGHERRRRDMVPVCVRADLINLLCRRTPAERPLDGPDVVFAEHTCGPQKVDPNEFGPNSRHPIGAAENGSCDVSSDDDQSGRASATVTSHGMAESCSQLDVRTIARVAGDVLRFVSSMLRPHVQLAAENLFLRKQLALYRERQVKPRRADDATRIALVALSRLIDWRRVLTVVKPDTFIRWHRKGFRLFWRWKSSGWPTTIAGGTARVDRGHGWRRIARGARNGLLGTAGEARDSRLAANGSAIHAGR